MTALFMCNINAALGAVARISDTIDNDKCINPTDIDIIVAYVEQKLIDMLGIFEQLYNESLTKNASSFNVLRQVVANIGDFLVSCAEHLYATIIAATSFVKQNIC